jgi:hypothetical protein
MVTGDSPKIRSRDVLATSVGQTGGQWVCQPLVLSIDDRIWRLSQATARAVHDGMLELRATILWDMG